MPAQPHSQRAALTPPAPRRAGKAALDELRGPLTAEGQCDALAKWLDARLFELESRLHRFTTPASLSSWLKRR